MCGLLCGKGLEKSGKLRLVQPSIAGVLFVLPDPDARIVQAPLSLNREGHHLRQDGKGALGVHACRTAFAYPILYIDSLDLRDAILAEGGKDAFVNQWR
jgi:hypothetical protein